jgi:hypothetical protein
MRLEPLIIFLLGFFLLVACANPANEPAIPSPTVLDVVGKPETGK